MSLNTTFILNKPNRALRIYLLLTSVSILATLVFFGSKNDLSWRRQEWIKYQNVDYGFSIRYPKQYFGTVNPFSYQSGFEGIEFSYEAKNTPPKVIDHAAVFILVDPNNYSINKSAQPLENLVVAANLDRRLDSTSSIYKAKVCGKDVVRKTATWGIVGREHGITSTTYFLIHN